MAHGTVIRGKGNGASATLVRGKLPRLARHAYDVCDGSPVNGVLIFCVQPPVVDVFGVVANAAREDFIATGCHDLAFSRVVGAGCVVKSHKFG